MGLILLVTVAIFAVMVLPAWSANHKWGYGPSSVLGMVFLILLLLIINDVISLI